MGYRRRILNFVLVFATMIGAGIGVAGTAHADIYSNIWNTNGYIHLMNAQWSGSTPPCLYADPDTHNAEIWRCLNAKSEEWLKIPVSATGSDTDHFMLQSNWTSLCLAVPNRPSNGTPVVQAPCDASDVRQFWRLAYMNQGGDSQYTSDDNYHLISFLGVLCVDKPDGLNSPGLQLQMWTCAPQANWYETQHAEQWWQILARRQSS